MNYVVTIKTHQMVKSPLLSTLLRQYILAIGVIFLTEKFVIAVFRNLICRTFLVQIATMNSLYFLLYSQRPILKTFLRKLRI